MTGTKLLKGTRKAKALVFSNTQGPYKIQIIIRTMGNLIIWMLYGPCVFVKNSAFAGLPFSKAISFVTLSCLLRVELAMCRLF